VSREDASIKWLKSGEQIADSKKHKISNVGVTQMLEIDDVTFDDEAEYQCRCRDAVTSCMVFVEGDCLLFNRIGLSGGSGLVLAKALT